TRACGPEWSDPYRTFAKQFRNLTTHLSNQLIAIVQRQAGCRHGLSNPHTDFDGSHDGTSLAHCRAPTADRDRNHRRLCTDGHDEPPLLERKEIPGPAAGALGKNQEGIARLERLGADGYRSHR